MKITFQGFGFGLWRNRVVINGKDTAFWLLAVDPFTCFTQEVGDK